MRFHRFIRDLSSLFITLTLFVLPVGNNSVPDDRAQPAENTSLQQFDLLTDSSGWVLLGQQLFWTSDAAKIWEQIGPSLPPDGSIQDVEFINPQSGWVLWIKMNSDGHAGFHLAHTKDQGHTWNTSPLSLFDGNDIPYQVEKSQMGWFDEQTGWISIKQETGSNFSLGSLFTTVDGGLSWYRTELPVADQVFFSDPQAGWAVGGPGGDQIFYTEDAGATWQDREPQDLLPEAQAQVYPPFFQGEDGLLVLTTLGVQNYLKVYSLENDSAQWSPLRQFRLDVEPGILGLSILDEKNFVAVVPDTNAILRMSNGELGVVANQKTIPGSIVELDMASLDFGWAKSIKSECDTVPFPGDPGVPVFCSSTVRLLQTMDGGASWNEVKLPLQQNHGAENNPVNTPEALSSASDSLILENTDVFVGQAFDRCEIPTLSQMQIWSYSSPYRAVNLYIGGASRACDNNALTAAYLYQLERQGWKFIPTWVGPQAPCTGFKSRISFDPAIAYTQGVDQANLAVDRLAELGLTDPGKTGSVIYYDMEAYGTNQACREAVNSFMNGWVSQVKTRGNLAGVYGSTLCDTGLSDFLHITNVPDVIWAARWYHSLGAGYYDPTASVWDLGGCVLNTAWANHQRIRQYEGDHLENWGNLTLDIDSNALDGVVAIPYDYPNVASIVRADISPTNVAKIGFIVSFSKPVTGVDQADIKLTTTGVANVSLAGISGSGNTYTVSVNTGTGDGSIRLDMVDNDSIRDTSNNPLGGSGSGNGNYTYGPSYMVRKSSLFADVPGGYWAKNHIERLYQAGVTSGCNMEPLLYCPDSPVTRDQMAVFLLRAKHGPDYVPPAATGIFQDVPSDYWAAAWIEQLAAEGITSGCSTNPIRYCPATPVTRDQMAVFLLRAAHDPSYFPPAPTGVFEDVPVGYWAAAWIEQLAAEGITSGCSASPALYCPTTPVSRDQMSIFLVESFNLP